MPQPAWPDLTALPGVAEPVEAARRSIAALHAHPVNRRGWPTSAAAASVRGARASSVLDGGAGSGDPDEPTVLDPVLAGSLRAAAALPGLVPVWERAPLQAVARLHTLAAADLLPGSALGRPDQHAGAPRSAGRLAALADVAVSADWPAPILVAVVHGELLALHAFGAANGVVARASARLVMIASGLDPHGLSVPEVGHLRAGAAYGQAARGFAAGTTEGVAAWIRHVCAALEAGAREGLSIASAGAQAG